MYYLNHLYLPSRQKFHMKRIVKNNSINNNNKYLNILYIKKIFSMYMKRVYDPKKYEGHTPHILQTVHPNKLLFQIPIKTSSINYR